MTADADSLARILVTRKGTWKQEADESYAIEGSEYPFLVIEAVDTQTHASLRMKLHGWAQGTKTRCKVVFVFELERIDQLDYRILMSVIKNNKVPSPRPDRPNGFRVVQECVHDRIDISSSACPGSFAISAREVCPEEWRLDPATEARVVDIPFALFRASALAAIREKKAQVARAAGGGPSPRNSDQEDASTPSSSTSGSFADEILTGESGSEEDDQQDVNYDP